MLFKITSLNSQQQKEIRYFDNISLKVFDENKNQIDFYKDVRYSGLYSDEVLNNHSEYKSDCISHLRIQLGLNCNYSCKYCLQENQRKEFISKEIQLPPEITSKNFIKVLTSKIKTINKITLWGGEPLVYIKLLYHLVPLLKKHYPEARIFLISNGSLLTKKITDFLIKYSINLDVSHDGESFHKFRNDKDPFDNPKVIECIKEYLNFCESKENIDNIRFQIRTVIVPLGVDLNKTFEFFYKKFNRKVPIFFESIVRINSKEQEEYFSFTSQQSQDLIKNLIQNCSTVSNSKNNPYWSLRNDISSILVRIVNQQSFESTPYRCGNAKKDQITIDLKGNLISCPSENIHSAFLGHISQLEKLKVTQFHTWKDRINCSKCPFLVGCKGACSIASNEKHNFICKNYKIYYTALFLCAWKILFQSLIINIESIKD